MLMSISETFWISELSSYFLSFLTNMVSHPSEKERRDTIFREENNSQWCLVSLCGRRYGEVSMSEATFYQANATNELTNNSQGVSSIKSTVLRLVSCLVHSQLVHWHLRLKHLPVVGGYKEQHRYEDISIIAVLCYRLPLNAVIALWVRYLLPLLPL